MMHDFYRFHLHLKHSLNNMTQVIQRNPLGASICISTVNYTVCDIIIQTFVENRNYQQWDKKRTLFFNQFGMWYIGIGQFYLYVRLFPKFFEGYLFSKQAKLGRMLQVCTAVIIYGPFIYFPSFYIAKESFYDGIGIKSFEKGYKLYFQENFWNDNKRGWGIWIPAHLLTFNVIPPYLRPFWTNLVSFVWTMILSAYNGAPDEL